MMEKNVIKKDSKKKTKIKCWEVFRCGEEACPAYKSRNLRCWLISGTCCRGEIQGKFLEKIEMCLDCTVYKRNLDAAAMKITCSVIRDQFREHKRLFEKHEEEIKQLSMELAMSLSEVFEALRKIASGDPTVRIPEVSEIELISKLKHLVNLTARDIGEIVEQSHEFAVTLAEHFDVLHRVSQGDFTAQVTGVSQIGLLGALKNITNEMIRNIDRTITERIRAEEEIRKLETLESSILSTIPHAVIGLKKRAIFFANEAVETVFGWVPEELIGQNTRILYRTDEEYEEIGRRFYPLMERQRTHSEVFSCKRKDASDIICKISASVIGERLKDKGIVVMYEDITKQTMTEQALEDSEKKYRDLYEKAPDGYHSLDPDGRILDVNETWLRLFGYTRDEVIGRHITEFLAGKNVEVFCKIFGDLKQEGSYENIEYEFRKKDGTHIPVLVNATAIYDQQGTFIKSRAIIRDITERKSYEAKLRNAAEEWRKTFDAMPYGVLLLDPEFGILRANEYVVKLFNISFQDIIGKSFVELAYDETTVFEGRKVFQAHQVLNSQTFEYFLPDQKRSFAGSITPVFHKQNILKNYILLLIDITESRDKEQKLIESRDAFLNMLREIDSSYKELQDLYHGIIHSFVNAIDAKSPWTKGHSERVTRYAVAIAKNLDIGARDIETLRIAALLHDIGKIGTYDAVLDKPGKLSPEEFVLIKQHPAKGEEILKPVQQLKHILPVIRHHHERIDGDGYPDGLKSEDIPLFSRIIAIADSFDSMTSNRPYRPAPSREYAISEITRCSGTQFDPQAAGAFIRFIKNEA